MGEKGVKGKRGTRWRLVGFALAALLVVGALGLGLSAAGASDGAGSLRITSDRAASFSVSPPVKSLSPARREAGTARAAPPRPNPRSDRAGRGGGAPDPLASDVQLTGHTPTPGLVFDGTGSAAACGGCAPPDPTGDVGPSNYVQMVNGTKIAIFNKSGTLLTPIFNLGALWPMADICAGNGGDPQVNYDEAADRWVLSQLNGSNRLCFAVSQTANPTGSYYLFNFNVGVLPDYYKVGVWSNGYYVSDDENGTHTFLPYAFDRAKMLAGDLTATYIKISPITPVGNFIMPADADGATQPSGGGLFYTFKDGATHGGADRIELFQMNPDFATLNNTTFALINTFPIAPFTYTVCGVFVTLNCIRQPNTSQRLDAFSEFPMQRLAYRDLGPYQALVGNFTVDTGTSEEGAGIRWFELRNTGSGWTLFQEGTHDPNDGNDRFFGSTAIDSVGNIALGYSVSSSALAPSIRYATRTPGDPAGTLQAEQTLQAGGGSQTGSNRWGDYSSMTVDPSDDCTFWYTNEYYSADAAIDWKTKIGHFVTPECLDPMPAFSPAPTAIGFGYGAVGASSPRTVTVTNTGQVTADLTISSVGLSGGNSGDFGIQNDTCSGESLDAGQTCTVQATFTPTRAGARATALRFTDDAAGSPHDIALTGTGASNGFTFGKLKRNAKKGIATLSVKVPGPGNLTLGGKGVKRAKKSAAAAGPVKLKVRPTGKKRTELRRTGTVKVRVKVTYAPTGGTPASKSRAVKLRLAR
jgi:Abnormal spindle-like microcephaly-assoc'd, ASPM-SPD-2-Hydin